MFSGGQDGINTKIVSHASLPASGAELREHKRVKILLRGSVVASFIFLRKQLIYVFDRMNAFSRETFF